MTENPLDVLDHELEQYLSSLLGGLGRVERCQALCWYATGLLLSGERKSMAPMAARLSPEPKEQEAVRQRLQQAVAQADWDPAVLYRGVSQQLVPVLGKLDALIGDDTGIARHGDHCVGTARQYSGTLGRVDRCQVIPSLHAAGPSGSFCLGARLYLPESWTCDPVRLAKAGVPCDIEFATKWQIMLTLIEGTQDCGTEALPFIGDAGYGDVAEFRRELNQRKRPYVMEVMSTTAVWAPGTGPVTPLGKQAGRMGRPQTAYRDGEHVPVSVVELALSQTEAALQEISWQNGDGPVRKSRFGWLRVKPASGHCHGKPPEPEQFLVWQWPEATERPEHYWLSTLDETTPLQRLVYLAKLRWRVERDYQEMKAEVGLDHYEGRNWRGLHHHLSLCALAHGFLVLKRARWQKEQAAARPEGPRPARKKTPDTAEPASRNPEKSRPSLRPAPDAAQLDAG